MAKTAPGLTLRKGTKALNNTKQFVWLGTFLTIFIAQKSFSLPAQKSLKIPFCLLLTARVYATNNLRNRDTRKGGKPPFVFVW